MNYGMYQDADVPALRDDTWIKNKPDLCDQVVYTEGGYDIREPQCFETLGPEGSIKRNLMSCL